MDLIYSTSTTYSAITVINNRLTGGTFDNSQLYWLSYSGGNVTKRDILYPNTAITNSNYTKSILIAGGGNSGLSYSNSSTIFAGTGHTVNYLNNKILSGKKNSFKTLNGYDPDNTAGVSTQGSSVIFGGQLNSMSGANYSPEISVILNGSGNSINNLSSSSNYSDEFKRNSILNGLSNSISGNVGNSWIGNGFENTISTSPTFFTKGNYILNGYRNTITNNLSTNADYNTIIGGYDNTTTDKNNSIVIGSGLIGSANTTSVNRMFVEKKMFFNDYIYLEIDASNVIAGSPNTVIFNHENKTVGVIKQTTNAVVYVIISSGSYIGQVLYLIGIPKRFVGVTNDIGLYTSILGGNIISKDVTINAPATVASDAEALTYSGLAVFVWNGTYWIRADHRGGTF